MKLTQIVIPIVSLLASTALLTEGMMPEPVYGIPKAVYDQIKHFDTLGIDPSDIDANDLGFESGSLQQCIETVPSRYFEKDKLAIAYFSCVKRHPIEYTVIT